MAEGTQSEGGSGGGKKAEEPQRYESEYLIRNAASLLDSRRTFVAAALALSDRQTHTVDQAKELLGKLEKVRTHPDDGAAEDAA